MRMCTCCGTPMTEGFVIEGGNEYYCSERCLHKRYTPEEYNAMYDDGEGESYWTEFDD